MKRALIAALLALLLGAFLVTLIVQDPGYVLIAYGNYTIESSVWILLLGAVLLLMSLFVLARIVRSIGGGASFVGRWFGGMSERQAQKYTQQGLMAMLEGNHQLAKKLLTKAAPNLELSLVNAWLMAKLPEVDEKLRRETLDQVQEALPKTEAAITLLRAELCLREKNYPAAVQLLLELEPHSKKMPAVYLLMYQAKLGLADWVSAVALLAPIHDYGLMNHDEWLDSARRSYWQLFDPELARRRDKDGKIFRHAWEKRPTLLKEDATLAARYARCLMALDNDEAVELLLRNWLDKSWSADLVELYGWVEGVDIKRQLKQAEKWSLLHSDDPLLMLTLGRLCLRNQLWGRARDYFEQSYRRQPRPETSAELARLLSHLGEHEKSEKYYREGLISRIGGLPVLPQPSARATK
jgi:HemY protein